MKLVDIINNEPEATAEPGVDGIRLFEDLGFQQLTQEQFKIEVSKQVAHLRQQADYLNKAYRNQQLDRFATGRDTVYMQDPKTRQLYRVE